MNDNRHHDDANSADIERLAQALLGDEISTEDREQFEQSVVQNPEARREYVRYIYD